MSTSAVKLKRHISPFRYPGGKSWLYPIFRDWFRCGNSRTLVELFAGGASIGLQSLEEGLCDHLVMIERDPEIAAVWRTILGTSWRELVARIENFSPTLADYRKELAAPARTQINRAWQALIRNRLNHGGIMANGASPLRNGEAGKGLQSRWYPETLVSRIRRIRSLKSGIEFLHSDALRELGSRKWKGCSFFVDPPYPKAGRRLYSHFSIDHEQLLEQLGLIDRPFFASYEDIDEVKRLAERFNYQVSSVSMFARCHRRRTELLISNRQDMMSSLGKS